MSSQELFGDPNTYSQGIWKTRSYCSLTLPKTNSSHLPGGLPERFFVSSNPSDSGATLVSGSVYTLYKRW